MAPLLQVKGLKTQFFTQDGIVHAVNGVSYDVEEGETLGIVGESGCGKSVGVLSVMRLIPQPPGKIVAGQVLFQGNDRSSSPKSPPSPQCGFSPATAMRGAATSICRSAWCVRRMTSRIRGVLQRSMAWRSEQCVLTWLTRKFAPTSIMVTRGVWVRSARISVCPA